MWVQRENRHFQDFSKEKIDIFKIFPKSRHFQDISIEKINIFKICPKRK